MAKIYLTTNVNKVEPQEVRSVGHIHVKAKNDGSQTIIISEDVIVSPNILEKTFDEAQDILDTWVDLENTTPEQDNDGNLVYQNHINLGAYFA